MASSLHSKLLRTLRSAFACALPLLGLVTVGAQSFPSGVVTSVAGNPRLMATGDFNRDGNADLIYLDPQTGVINADSGGNLRVLLGNGDGTFRVGQSIPLAAGIGSVINVGDLNGDGIPDLVLGFNGFQGYGPAVISVLLGNGDGTFKPVISNAAYTYGSPQTMQNRMGIADFDGDGNADVIYTDGYEFLYFMKGDGKGNLAKPVMMQAGVICGDVLVGDFNGDGKPDLVIPSSYSFDVYLNPGNANFKMTSSVRSPLYSTGQKTLALGDLNGDGHLDIIFNGVSVSYGAPDGTFAAPVQVGSVPHINSSVLGVADLHGDKKPRVFIFGSQGVGIALGATPGGAELYAGTQYLYSQSVIADFNNDGLMDVAIPGDKSISILYGNPDGTFRAAPSYATASGVGGLTSVDANGDNTPDVVLSQNLVYAGIGDGTLAANPISPGYGYPFQLYSGDFDGNGRLGFYSNLGIFHNNGTGAFTATSLDNSSFSAAPFPTGFAVVADFNHDGFADVALSASRGGFASPSTSGNAVYIATSNGKGAFTYVPLNFSEPVGPLGAGDFNGDGCPDLTVGAATQIEIFLGDCKGNFQQGASYLTNTGATVRGTVGGLYTSIEPSDIAVTDLDGDGHLDIIYTVPGQSLAKVLYGKGDGTFTSGADLALPHSSIYVTATDLNSDGATDLIFSGQNLVTLYYGQNSRSWTAPTVLDGGFVTGKAVVADLNRDGNPDFVIPNLEFDGGDDSNDSGFSFTVFINQLPSHRSDALNTRLIVLPEPSTYNQPFTATATFTPVANTSVPGGTATFSLDGGSATPGLLSSTGVASATFPTASVGTHTVAVSFPGDSNFAAATASVQHLVVGSSTSTTLTCTPSTIAIAGSATLIASVTSAGGTPTGSISFTDNAVTLATQPLLNASTQFNCIGTTVGTHALTATYIPTGSFAASFASCTETVTALPTTSVLTVAQNPVAYGSPVQLTATVSPTTPPGPSVPTGTVTFFAGTTVLGTSTVTGGIATLTTSILPGGTDNLTCSYSGSAIYASSNCNTVPVLITPTATTLTLTSSLNPAPALSSVTFTAILTTNGRPTPAGNTITLAFNGQNIVLTTDTSGSARYTTGSLSPGTYPVSANFAATSSLTASSATLSQVILPGTFTINLLPTSVTITAGASASIAIQLASVGNFAGPLTLTCGPLPTNATASISPSAVTLTAGGSGAATLKLNTVLRASNSAPSHPGPRELPIAFAVTLLLLPLGLMRRRKIQRLLSVLMLALALHALIGCSNLWYTPNFVSTGNYQLPVTATDASGNTQTAILSVTVTPY